MTSYEHVFSALPELFTSNDFAYTLTKFDMEKLTKKEIDELIAKKYGQKAYGLWSKSCRVANASKRNYIGLKV